MSDYYDKDGKPLELLEWARLFENYDYKRIGLDEAYGVRISTVWLGLNHGFGDGLPLIFETMVFGGDDDLYEERYSTLKQAEAGHKRIAKKYLRRAKKAAERSQGTTTE